MADHRAAADANAEFVRFVNSLPEDAFTSPGDSLLGQPALPLNNTLDPYLFPEQATHDSAGEIQSGHVDQLPGIEEPDYGKFENWIEGYLCPDNPCDYCRTRKLHCHMKAGSKGCTACISLFRECSLSESGTLEALNYANGESSFFDTLHPVAEDAVKERGQVTGIKSLASKTNFNSGKRSSSSSPVRNDDAPGSSKRNGIRFPRRAVKILRDWLDAHSDHPYPTEQEKADLERETELKPTQIANWLANTRRRRRNIAKSLPKGGQSPILKAATPAIAIPSPDKPWDELNPFERWQHSPPENEPASVTDIAQAIAKATIPDDGKSVSGSSMYSRRQKSSNGSNASGAHAQSVVSGETGHSSWSAVSSLHTPGSSSHASSFGSFSSGLAGKRDRRRKRRHAVPPARPTADAKRRIFQCTFCTDTFKSKYDWTRHEKSLHLSLEKWVCAPQGPIVEDRDTGILRCAYCGHENPDDDHVETHNHSQCSEKGLEARTFFRKDHLRQHLRLMHSCELLPIMEPWKSVATHVNCRCGFCAKRFTVWQERIDHLTAHFKAGARMAEWTGCRGLDPAVAAQVTNAMPPYLIGLEQLSPVPFSATDRTTWLRELEVTDKNIVNQCLPSGVIDTKTTCWERLTIRLGKFASDAALRGEILTDETLQREARMIIYENDDPWNTTAADNPEWLDLFKKAHGFEFIPSVIGGKGNKIPEDLETYGDLGLRIPFAIQLKAYNEAHAASQNAAQANVLGDVSNPLEQERKSNLQKLCAQLQEGGILHEFKVDCGHIECAANTLDVGLILGNGLPDVKRWCTFELPAEQALELAVQSFGKGTSSPQHEENQEEQRRLNLSQGLQSLFNLDSRVFRTTGQSDHDSTQVSNDAQTQPLHSPAIAHTSSGTTYIPRYQYQLPQEQARKFATITPAWSDPGKMPPVQETQSQRGFTTGAMMEFLGGELGEGLPFSQDVTTSPLILSDTAMQALNPSPDGIDWLAQEGTAQHERTVMDSLDQLIAKSTAADQPNFTVTDSGAPAAGPLVDGTPSGWNDHLGTSATERDWDLAMADVSFDDLDFDDIFDLEMKTGS